MENKMVMAWVRLALFLLPAINTILAMNGLSPLPFNEHQLENTLIMVIGIIGGTASWWKDNSVTKKDQLKKAAVANKTEDELKELAGK